MKNDSIKISLKGGIVAIMIVSVLSMAFATIFLTKPLTSTAILVTNANFKIYSDSACTTEITQFDLGNVVRGQTITKLAWLKFTTAPEAPMKYSFDKGTTDPLDITIEVRTMPSDLVVAVNTQFGATHTTITSIEAVKIIYTISMNNALGDVITSTINWNANNPPV